jgi:hypothetical protein
LEGTLFAASLEKDTRSWKQGALETAQFDGLLRRVGRAIAVAEREVRLRQRHVLLRTIAGAFALGIGGDAFAQQTDGLAGFSEVEVHVTLAEPREGRTERTELGKA